MTTPRATIDFSRHVLSGEGDRFLFTAPLTGPIDDAVADELFHGLRREIVRRQAEEEVPRIERVTLRVRDAEVQVILHGDAAAVDDWVVSGRFREALEQALDDAHVPPLTRSDERRP